MADEIINGLIERQVEPLKADIERLEAQVERCLARAHVHYKEGVAAERERCARMVFAYVEDIDDAKRLVTAIRDVEVLDDPH